MVIWKDVEGFEGLYKVSNEGVVISTPRQGSRGGVTKYYKMSHGYYEYLLCKDGKMYHVMAHRLLAKHFIPNPDNKPCVNHIDGDRNNNSLENLEWVTYKENTQHAVRSGLFNNKGENNPKTKLTDKEIYQIRDLHKHKVYNQKELAEIYGTCRSNVSYIVRNKTRKVAGN